MKAFIKRMLESLWWIWVAGWLVYLAAFVIGRGLRDGITPWRTETNIHNYQQ